MQSCGQEGFKWHLDLYESDFLFIICGLAHLKSKILLTALIAALFCRGPYISIIKRNWTFLV